MTPLRGYPLLGGEALSGSRGRTLVGHCTIRVWRAFSLEGITKAAAFMVPLFAVWCGAVQPSGGAAPVVARVRGAAAQESTGDSTVGPGIRRALILCGHPGTAEFGEVYRRSVDMIRDALVSSWGYSGEHVWIRCGTDSEPGSDPGPGGSRGPATRAALAADVAQLQQVLSPDDSLWVIAIGHSHFDGRNVFWNLPGPDLSQSDFGALFKPLRCREQVFFITIPASGLFVRDLSAPGRVVITATAADAETNESQFQWHLARVLHDPPRTADGDRDQDGRLSLLDVYLGIVRRVMTEYRDCKLIPTEHALLDDNGDGRGTELQLDDLEPELGGRAVRRPWSDVLRAPHDGVLSASILIGVPTPGAEDGQPRPRESSSENVKGN